MLAIINIVELWIYAHLNIRFCSPPFYFHEESNFRRDFDGLLWNAMVSTTLRASCGVQKSLSSQSPSRYLLIRSISSLADHTRKAYFTRQNAGTLSSAHDPARGSLSSRTCEEAIANSMLSRGLQV